MPAGTGDVTLRFGYRGADGHDAGKNVTIGDPQIWDPICSDTGTGGSLPQHGTRVCLLAAYPPFAVGRPPRQAYPRGARDGAVRSTLRLPVWRLPPAQSPGRRAIAGALHAAVIDASIIQGGYRIRQLALISLRYLPQLEPCPCRCPWAGLRQRPLSHSARCLHDEGTYHATENSGSPVVLAAPMRQYCDIRLNSPAISTCVGGLRIRLPNMRGSG